MKFFLAFLLLPALLRAAAPTQDDAGRIILPFEPAGAARQSWTHTATRWGMYRLSVIVAPGGPAGGVTVPPLTFHFGDKSLRVDGKSSDLRLYLAQAGKITLRADFDAPPAHLAGLALVPAPEGALDLRQQPDGQVLLHAKDATIVGVKARYEPKPEKNTIGFWTEPKDSARWEFTVHQPGAFDVQVLQGCGTGQGGSNVAVEVAGQSLFFVVQDTGHFQNFTPRIIGRVTLAQNGPHTLKVQPLTKAKAAVMDLRQVRLIPVNP
jgi:hypothetical protein